MFRFLKAHPRVLIVLALSSIFFFIFPILVLIVAGILALYETLMAHPEERPDAYSKHDEVKPSQGYPFMKADEKALYLRSPVWKHTKMIKRYQANCKCEVCGSKDSLDLHHNTYKRLGHEKLTDLNIVCRTCHQAIHDKLGYDRTTDYPISVLEK